MPLFVFFTGDSYGRNVQLNQSANMLFIRGHIPRRSQMLSGYFWEFLGRNNWYCSSQQMRQVRNTAASGKQAKSSSSHNTPSPKQIPECRVEFPHRGYLFHVPPHLFLRHSVSHHTGHFLRVNAAINRLTRSRYKRQTNSAGWLCVIC